MYFFKKKHDVHFNCIQDLQSTGMQVVENTCIRHEMSLRKISKSLALGT